MRQTERLVLDTSAYSHLRAGRSDVLDFMADATVVVMPVIVLGELEAGFEMGSRMKENRHVLGEFLDEPFVSISSVTTDTVRYYARIFAALRLAGTPIPVNDVWIAATTMECGGHLLTYDTDYGRISGLDYTLLERSH